MYKIIETDGKQMVHIEPFELSPFSVGQIEKAMRDLKPNGRLATFVAAALEGNVLAIFSDYGDLTWVRRDPLKEPGDQLVHVLHVTSKEGCEKILEKEANGLNCRRVSSVDDARKALAAAADAGCILWIHEDCAGMTEFLSIGRNKVPYKNGSLISPSENKGFRTLSSLAQANPLLRKDAPNLYNKTLFVSLGEER